MEYLRLIHNCFSSKLLIMPNKREVLPMQDEFLQHYYSESEESEGTTFTSDEDTEMYDDADLDDDNGNLSVVPVIIQQPLLILYGGHLNLQEWNEKARQNNIEFVKMYGSNGYLYEVKFYSDDDGTPHIFGEDSSPPYLTVFKNGFHPEYPYIYDFQNTPEIFLQGETVQGPNWVDHLHHLNM